jgi:hypothetical protein
MREIDSNATHHTRFASRVLDNEGRDSRARFLALKTSYYLRPYDTRRSPPCERFQGRGLEILRSILLRLSDVKQ